MRNYYVFIFLLWTFCIGLVVTGFTVVGNPISQKNIQLDTTRISDFSQIQSAVITYYQQKKVLPTSLVELKVNSTYISTTDPESNKEYVYNKLTSTSYSLCTTFALDSKDIHSTFPAYSNYGTSTNHKKGYDCITYILPNYVDNNSPVQAVSPTIAVVPSISSTCSVIEITGTIKAQTTIGTQIEGDKGENMTITKEVNGVPTKMIGNPQVGDRVKVSSKSNCQYEIEKIETTKPTP